MHKHGTDIPVCQLSELTGTRMHKHTTDHISTRMHKHTTDHISTRMHKHGRKPIYVSVKLYLENDVPARYINAIRADRYFAYSVKCGILIV